MSPPVPDSPPPPDKPLPPPPALPFPTLLSLRELVQPSSDLDLDQRSWEHVRDLAKQSLKNVKEGEEVWLEPMLSMLHSLADYITASRIDLLSQSAIGEWKASDNSGLLLASSSSGKGKEKEKAKEKDRVDKLKAPSVEEATLEKEKVLQLRRAGWMNARSLIALTHPVVPATITTSSSSSTLDSSLSAKDELSSLDTVESNVDPVAELEALDVPHEGDLSWTSISADLEPPPAVLPKLTHFGLRLRVTETTVGAVAAGAVALGVQFEEGNWDGDGLFGRAFLEDPADPNLELLGGALHLTCYHRETTKLSRILELLAFATLSLKLEAHLMRDASCARPLLLETASEVDFGDERDEGSGSHTPIASQRVPVDGVDILPSEEWSSEGKQGKGKSRWSKSSIWGILTGHTSLSESKHPLPRTKTATPSNPFPRSETVESITSLSSASRHKAPSIMSFDSQAHPLTARNVKERFKERFSKRSRRVGSGSWGGPSVGSEYDGMGIENGWDFIGGLGIAVQASGSSVGRQQKTGLVSLREEDGRHKELPAQKIEKVSEPEVTDRFQIVIKAMEKCILSTSPDVIFPPPHLLVRLRQQELAQAALLPPQPPLDSGVSIKPLPFRPLPKSIQSSAGGRLRSYSTIDAQALAIGFASGKDGLADLGKENGSMSSTTSERVARIALDARAGLASLLTNNNSLAGAVRHQGIQFLVETVARDAAANQIPCLPPKWLVFDYYQQEDTLADTASSTTKDVSLGQLIERLVDNRDLPCEAAGCKKLRHDHCIYYMHSKERICISLSTIPTSDADPILPLPFKADPMKPRISLWTICQTCHATTPPQLISTATMGVSFAKYAEILLYDPDFVPLPDLCEHAVLERGALVRCFAIDRTVVSLRMDKIELFELRLPTSVNPDIESEAEACSKDTDAESADMLRHEIRSFYVSVRRRLDYLQDLLEELQPKSTTIKGINPTKVAPGERPEHIRSSSEKTIVEGDAEEESEEEDSAGTLKGSQQPLHLLVKLRNVFELDESDLLSSTNDLNAQRLNNGRWQFITKANNSKSRIAAWEKKHFGDGKVPDDPIYSQPEYFAKGIHVFPCDSSLLVRESELSSLIALTLSAKNFQDELAGPSVVSSRSASAQGIFGSPLIDPPKRPLARAPIPVELLDAWKSPLPLSTNSSIRSTTPPRSPRPGFFSMRSTVLDADNFSVEMSPSEEMEYCAKVKKGGPPRIASSILSGGSSILSGSIRALSRQKSTDSFGFFRSPIVTPTEDADEKRFSRGPISDSVLEDLIATADIPPSPKPSAHLRAVPSVIATIGKRHASEPTTNLSTGDFFAHSTRSSETSSLHSMDSVPGTPELRASSPSAPGNDHDDKQDDVQHPMDPPERPSRLISGPLNALFSLPGSLRMRNGISSPKSLGSGSYNGASSSSAHIKFNFRHGEKEFRVTSYFAKRFQSLRTKCGLSETLFTESLSRCSDLNPSGGKSKAAFLMTGDRRFILKELVTAWNISERESFLTFAPALLDYLMAPEKPSLLAKIFGFYTVKTKNHKTGEVKKVDLVVMEHLFHSQTITRQFDLKGVASRVAKVKSGSGSGSSEAKVESSTGWDHDFLNGTLTTRLLIYSHSKTLLLDALRNDTQFLSEAGNIDYSLLVGVDGAHISSWTVPKKSAILILSSPHADEKKELVVGLIDTLGVFNTLKMLENVGKTALKKATSSDTETVTILPPSDYASRFRQAMGRYFVAVPEKFSRPPGAILDPDPRLPSVL